MTTELIYTEVHHCYSVITYPLAPLILLQGCIPQLVSYFYYIHHVVFAVSITIVVLIVMIDFIMMTCLRHYYRVSTNRLY